MNQQSIMIVGVGGQGTLLSSRLLGNILIKKGYDVKLSEVHGMSQRGGAVVTYVKYGDSVNSPVIEKGEADIILAFEQLEAARWLPYLKKDGAMIVNTEKIEPMTVISGKQEYPDDIIGKLHETGINLTAVDALTPAIEAGTAKAVNVVLMGVLANVMQSGKELWIEAIKETVPARFTEMNLKAFEAGYQLIKQPIKK